MSVVPVRAVVVPAAPAANSLRLRAVIKCFLIVLSITRCLEKDMESRERQQPKSDKHRKTQISWFKQIGGVGEVVGVVCIEGVKVRVLCCLAVCFKYRPAAGVVPCC